MKKGWQCVDEQVGKNRTRTRRRGARVLKYGRRYWMSEKRHEEAVRKHNQDFTEMANKVLAKRDEHSTDTGAERQPYPWEE